MYAIGNIGPRRGAVEAGEGSAVEQATRKRSCRAAWLAACATCSWLLLGPPLARAEEPAPPADEPACDGEDAQDPACQEVEATTVIVGKRPPPPGTITQVDAREISLRGARNLPEAIAAEPSVDIQQGPKAGATLQIRGFDERSVLVTIEGIPIREVYDGHFDISSLPVFSLGSITLERGIASLAHGPNSAGGVLALRVPAGCDGAVDASLYGGRPHDGALLLYGGRLRACTRLSDFTLQLGAGYERADGYVIADDFEQTEQNAQYHEDGGLREGSDYARSSVALLAKYAPRRNQSLSLFVDLIDSPRGIPPFEGSGYVRYWRFSDYDTALVGLSGVYGPALEDLSSSWGFLEVRGQLYVHVHRDELRDYEDASYTHLTTNPLAWFVASAYANESYGAAVQASWSLNDGNRLDASLRYNLDVHRQREIPVPRGGAQTTWTPFERYSAHTYSAALEDTQVLGAWRLSGGLGVAGLSLGTEEIRETSYAVDDRVIPAFEGRLVAECSVAEGLQLVAAAGHKVRFPMLKELFSNSLGGNPDLDSERAWMVEAGFDAKGFPVAGLEASARGFFNSIEDLIDKYRDAYANVGQALTAGVELEVRYRPLGWLQLLAGYRYLYSRDLDRDRPLDYRTPHRVLAGARALTDFGLTGGVQVSYSSGQQAYYFDTLSGVWIEDRLAGYVLLGAHLRYDFAFDEVSALYAYVDGLNLLGADYNVGSFEPRPGREFVFGLGGRM